MGRGWIVLEAGVGRDFGNLEDRKWEIYDAGYVSDIWDWGPGVDEVIRQ